MRLIDADKLLKDIEQYHLSDGFFQHWVEVQPTIEERKKGKWIVPQHDLVISGTCSCCGWDAILFETDVVGMPYCPNCGAEMEDEDNGR